MKPDWQRLLRYAAGARSVLGVDITGERARIVELELAGFGMGRSQPGFRVRKQFELRFDPAEADKGAVIQRALKDEGIATRLAILAVGQSSVRQATVALPPGIERIDEWIEEHLESLLRVPASPSEILFRYEILDKESDSPRLNIFLVRRQELIRILELADSAALQLLGIAPGVKDLERLLDPSALDATLLHIDQKTVTRCIVEAGKVRKADVHPTGESSELTDLLEDANPEKSVFISGDVSGVKIAGAKPLEPFDLSAGFALSAALAMRGFDAQPSLDFLPAKIKTASDVVIHKSLLQRMVIGLGVMLMVLLLTPLLLNGYLQSRLDVLDVELGETRLKEQEVSTLEEQVKNLEQELTGSRLTTRTQMARLLHDLAARTSDGIWLYELKVGEKAKGTVRLKGFARGHAEVMSYLKELGRSSLLSEVNLIRQGAPEEGEPVEAVSRHIHQLVTFEISAEVQQIHR